jgi:hypothetical protein
MKPTDGELEMAIIAAEELWQSGRDEHHLAKTLLYLYQRLDVLEKVRTAAENCLHSGQEASRQEELRQAIEAADRMERRDAAATDADETPG